MMSLRNAVTIFHGGTIRTMERDDSVVEALAIQEGRILASGTLVAVEHAVEASGQTITSVHRVDLAGGCLVPGMLDNHQHRTIVALLEASLDCGRAHAPDMASLLRLVRTYAETIPKGAWILAHGFDDLAIDERRAPTLDELTEACPDHSLLLMHFSFHEGVVNRRALEACSHLLGEVDPRRGEVRRDAEGRPTGRLIEEAVSPVLRIAIDDAFKDPGRLRSYVELLARHEQRLFALGLTYVVEPGVHPALENVLANGYREGLLRVPMTLMVVGEGGFFHEPSDRLGGEPSGTVLVPDTLQLGPLKLFMDGGVEVGVRLSAGQMLTASLRATGRALATRSLDGLIAARSVGLRWQQGAFHGGRMIYETQELCALCRRAHARGFDIAVHAMGNDAIDRTLGAFELLAREAPLQTRVTPPRIEHFAMPEPAHLARAADLGVAVVIQPGFVPRAAASVLGAGFPRPQHFLPISSMLRAGLVVAGSSDAPVIDFDPLKAMRASIWRPVDSEQGKQAGVFGASESITAAQALAMYTREGAKAAGLKDRGTLVKGHRADLVWLDADPVKVLPLDLPLPRVKATYLAGIEVHSSPDGASRP